MTSAIRVVARLDIKSPNLIKGIRLEGLRVVGDPHEHALRYFRAGADEILYIDIVASLYGRNSLADLVRRTSEDVFVPMTVGGGVRSIDDARSLLRAGADKISVNTAAIQRPDLIGELCGVWGSSTIVLSVEAKRTGHGWEAYTDNGRERTGLDVRTWCEDAQRRGVGEILLTSVDREGTRSGFDLELLDHLGGSIEVPLILSGGFGTVDHALDAVRYPFVTGLAIADALHYGRHQIRDIKTALALAGVNVRS